MSNQFGTAPARGVNENSMEVVSVEDFSLSDMDLVIAGVSRENSNVSLLFVNPTSNTMLFFDRLDSNSNFSLQSANRKDSSLSLLGADRMDSNISFLSSFSPDNETHETPSLEWDRAMDIFKNEKNQIITYHSFVLY